MLYMAYCVYGMRMKEKKMQQPTLAEYLLQSFCVYVTGSSFFFSLLAANAQMRWTKDGNFAIQLKAFLELQLVSRFHFAKHFFKSGGNGQLRG